MTQVPQVLEYGRKATINRWVMGVFVASVVAALGFFFVVPALVVLVAAIVMRSIAKSHGVGGMGLANAAVRISAWSAAIGVVFMMMATSLCACGSREMANRGTCGANIRGIVQSMNVYAAENNGCYPIVPFAPYASAPNEPAGLSTGTADAAAAMRSYFSAAQPQAGSVPACFWMLVVNGQVSPKQFVCKSDGSMSAQATDASGNYFDNFQNGSQLSYSFAYPWNAAGKSGAWWKDSGRAQVALLADMAPKQGTGTPARVLAPAVMPRDTKTWNSANHNGDGENVAFADAHAEFCRSPDVGEQRDNIYSMSGVPSRGPGRFGGIPAGATAPELEAVRGPYDIIMVPVRDANTGKI